MFFSHSKIHAAICEPYCVENPIGCKLRKPPVMFSFILNKGCMVVHSGADCEATADVGTGTAGAVAVVVVVVVGDVAAAAAAVLGFEAIVPIVAEQDWLVALLQLFAEDWVEVQLAVAVG